MKFRTVLAACLALSLFGCATADPAYKVANRNRLAAVKPRLTAYATTQPADEQQKVSDLLSSWQAEVTAQTGTAVAAPASK